jgi:hypothetical protein
MIHRTNVRAVVAIGFALFAQGCAISNEGTEPDEAENGAAEGEGPAEEDLEAQRGQSCRNSTGFRNTRWGTCSNARLRCTRQCRGTNGIWYRTNCTFIRCLGGTQLNCDPVNDPSSCRSS